MQGTALSIGELRGASGLRTSQGQSVRNIVSPG